MPAESWKDAFLRSAMLDGLDEPLQQALVAAAEPRVLDDGEPLVRVGESGRAAYVLLSGELAAERDGRLLALLEAPRVVGLLAALDGRERTAGLVATRRSELVTLPAPALETLVQNSDALTKRVGELLAKEIRAGYARQRAQNQAFEGTFLYPNAQLRPGPYVSDSHHVDLFVVEHDRAAIDALLPRGLRPLESVAGRYFLWAERVTGWGSAAVPPDQRVARHGALAILIPCADPLGRPALFCPERYVDSYMAIVTGRELFGFPDRFGRIEWRGDRLDAIVAQRHLLRIHWEKRRPCEAEEAGVALAGFLGAARKDALGRLAGATVELAGGTAPWLRLPVFVHRRITSAQHTERMHYDVDSLVEVPIQLSRLSDLALLEQPVLEWRDPRFFLAGRCVGGLSVQLESTLARGRDWIDYRGMPAENRTGRLR